MAIGWDRPGPPAEKAEIDRVEASLGVELPADYREFLERQNGGEPELNSAAHGGSTRYFYSAGPNDLEDIDDIESAAKRCWADPLTDPPEPPMDPSFLPIGEDAGLNRICLKVSGEDSGAVYFRYGDEAESPEAYDRLADSFSEFFEALHPHDPG